MDERILIEQLHDPSSRAKAFEIIVREYQVYLYWQVRRMVMSHSDADDIIQNTFLKAWTALDTFRGDSKIVTWLYRIAVNETLSFLDRQKKNGIHTDMSVAESLTGDPYFDGDKAQAQLQEAISRLPDKQRLIFNMKYFQEMKYDDISEVLGTSIGALKASYHIAVKKISQFFDQND